MYNFLACYNRIGYITVVPSLKIYANSRQVIFRADSVAPQILPVNLCLVQLSMLDKSNRMLEPALFNQPITTHSQNARQRCSFKLYPKIFLSRCARQTPSGYNCKTTHFYSPSWQKNSPPYRHQIDYARTTFHQIPKTPSGWPNRFMPQTLLVVCASQRKCRSASFYLHTLCSPHFSACLSAPNISYFFSRMDACSYSRIILVTPRCALHCELPTFITFDLQP